MTTHTACAHTEFSYFGAGVYRCAECGDQVEPEKFARITYATAAVERCRHALTYCDECHGTPAVSDDTALLDFAASCYESSDLDDPSGVVLRIVLPPSAGVTGDLRKDLRAALGLSSRGARS